MKEDILRRSDDRFYWLREIFRAINLAHSSGSQPIENQKAATQKRAILKRLRVRGGGYVKKGAQAFKLGD